MLATIILLAASHHVNAPMNVGVSEVPRAPSRGPACGRVWSRRHWRQITTKHQKELILAGMAVGEGPWKEHKGAKKMLGCDKKGCNSEGFLTHVNATDFIKVDINRGLPIPRRVPVVLCQAHNREWYMSTLKDEKLEFVRWIDSDQVEPEPSRVIQLPLKGLKGVA